MPEKRKHPVQSKKSLGRDVVCEDLEEDESPAKVIYLNINCYLLTYKYHMIYCCMNDGITARKATEIL